MAIQKLPGDIQVDADDPQFTTHGVTWAIKCRQFVSDWRVAYVVVKAPSGEWRLNDVPEANLISDFDQVQRERGNSVQRVFDEVILPRLRTWLEKTFVAGQTPNPVEDDTFVQFFNMTKKIRITSNVNGTVSLTVV